MPAVLCIMPITSSIWNGLAQNIFRDHGFLVAELAKSGFVFPVVRLEIDFKAPAVHDDLLSVVTYPVRVGGSSITLCQKIVRQNDEKLLAGGLVTLACTNPAFKATRIPLEIRQMLETQLRNETQALP